MFRKIIKGLKDVWCGTLEFDTEPKKDSFNPVTSGGVYDAINGAGGAKEIVYFDIDPSDPPSGIYAAITEALSKKKEPVLKIDGAVYFYTATGTDKYVFVGGYTKDAVGYTEIEVSDDDSVTSKSVDDKVFNMYMLYRTDPASPGDPPGTEDYWICDENKHVITKAELLAAHADCRYFILNNAVEPDSNSRKYFASVTDISNSYVRLRFYMMQYDAQGVAEFYQKTVMADSEGRLYILSSYSATLAGVNQAVLVSEPQNFDSTQKAQGRSNIGAASDSDVTALQSQVSSLSDVSAYSVKGEATVAQLNAGPSGIQAGWAYQLTDSGTLTDGSIAVVAGDTVAWDGTKWFPLVKSDYYATKAYAENVAASIAPPFDPTRNYVVGESCNYNGMAYIFTSNHSAGAWNPAHATVSGQNALLQLTAQNALAGNVAPAFDATRDDTNPYKAGECVIYNSKQYRFRVDHYGAWSASPSVVEEVVSSRYDVYLDDERFQSIGFTKAAYTYKARKTAEFFKLIEFYDRDNVGVEYEIRSLTLVSSDTILQVSLRYNGVYTDMKVATPDKTGVKEYLMLNNRKVMHVVVDWSQYEAQASGCDLYLTSKDFDIVAAGFNGSTSVQAINNSIVCPIQKVVKDGILSNIYVKSEKTGSAKILVGEVDQLLRFVVSRSYDVSVFVGENYIDVRSMNIPVRSGDQVAFQMLGYRYNMTEAGNPLGDDSFYYSSQSDVYQMETHPTKRICFGFIYVVDDSATGKMQSDVEMMEKEVVDLSNQVSELSGNIGFAFDNLGNKYRMLVVDGVLEAMPIDFKHVLVVGNSYTVHPTITDSSPLYTTYWWGHWSMAATAKSVSWPKLLEDCLKGNDVSSTVKTVFGRPWETGSKSIDANDAFVYWDNTNTKKNFAPNISDFSDTDCVILFLGDNYNGDDWYTKYTALVNKFATWFPSSMIYCVSTRKHPAYNPAIQQVAREKNCGYIDVYQKGSSNKVGSYVLGDDDNLYQITNTGVAGHPGDYGQIELSTIMASALNVDYSVDVYEITVSNASLVVENSKRVAGSIVSVFNEDKSVSSISVTSGGDAVAVTNHLNTDYGNIFTFVMPSGDVVVQ